MAIEVCLEGADAMVGLVDSGYASLVEAVRARSYRGRRSASTDTASGPATDVDPTAEEIRAATGVLTAKQACAVWLVDVCGLDYAQAGEVAGMSRGQIRRHVATARQSMMAHLSDPSL